MHSRLFRVARLTGAFVLLFAIITQAASTEDRSLLGFDTASTSAERALEERFDATLRAEDLRTWLKRLSARPHHLGSPYGKENAEFIASQFRSWGFDTQLEEFSVLFPTPKTRVVELTAPEKFTAKLTEPGIPEDATSGQASEQLPVYNAYSADGDVTAPLVYVNYGVPRDYEELTERGIDVKGKIVIARYGGSWRGIKPKVAAERGAVGCLIYSDPRNDGYYLGDVYPKGPQRNENGAQRGSVADMPLFPGDPLTPGVGATADAKRLDLKSAPTLTKIPVLPISYSDAQPLLRALGGPLAPESWRGALPLTYHLGAGPATVHLKVESNWNRVSAFDVVAKLRGSERPDEWVIRGNHHDAWVNGANDPLSGLVAMMAEAKGLGELVKSGWKPKRTIIYCAWDGEEPGLLGSTEWAETHADELRKKAVVYINSDSNARGFLGVSGSHTIEKFMNEVARDVIDPEKKITVHERARAQQILTGSTEARREARERTDLRIGALGSGSDYTVFLDHLGIASLNLGYGGEGDTGGVYHSIYDSFDHYTRFGDPNFAYGVVLAQTGGRAVLRFADAEVLPYAFSNFADSVGNYVREVVKLTDDMREDSKEKNRRIADKTFIAVFDPTETYVVPTPDDAVPFLNFAPLQNAFARLQESSRKYDAAYRINGGKLTAPSQQAVNRALMETERAMVREQGLPRRPWFKHQIYAPGFYTGYGVKTLPAIREAIEQRNWTEAEQQIGLVSDTINQIAAAIDRASAQLK
ncbi:MAG TPA: transferrin receptor-like dimerization domain-containing protein [Pyrinomonadaceae bacterium]|nr:transferrin receptor-like dimerization domain-containing protein [Pyrinomonadaceae bacterium]